MFTRNVRAVAVGLVGERSAKARIRDCGVQIVSEQGVAALTVRGVAEAAGVSAALVMHHYGSKDALRAACDEYVVAELNEKKRAAMAVGPSFDLLGALRDAEPSPIGGYLAAVLASPSPAVDRMVDGLVADAEQYLALGVASGMLQPSQDEHARAVVLTMWGLGALVMHDHLRRLLGVDLTDPALHSNALAPYAASAFEIYRRGLFTDQVPAPDPDARPEQPPAHPPRPAKGQP